MLGAGSRQGTIRATPEVLDGVRHHHEYLGGSPYPDALQGGQDIGPGEIVDDLGYLCGMG
jgi:hypothetical protein